MNGRTLALIALVATTGCAANGTGLSGLAWWRKTDLPTGEGQAAYVGITDKAESTAKADPKDDKATAAKAEPGKTETAKADAPKADASKTVPAKTEPGKTDPAKTETAQAVSPKPEANVSEAKADTVAKTDEPAAKSASSASVGAATSDPAASYAALVAALPEKDRPIAELIVQLLADRRAAETPSPTAASEPPTSTAAVSSPSAAGTHSGGLGLAAARRVWSASPVAGPDAWSESVPTQDAATSATAASPPRSPEPSSGTRVAMGYASDSPVMASSTPAARSALPWAGPSGEGAYPGGEAFAPSVGPEPFGGSFATAASAWPGSSPRSSYPGGSSGPSNPTPSGSPAPTEPWRISDREGDYGDSGSSSLAAQDIRRVGFAGTRDLDPTALGPAATSPTSINAASRPRLDSVEGGNWRRAAEQAVAALRTTASDPALTTDERRALAVRARLLDMVCERYDQAMEAGPGGSGLGGAAGEEECWRYLLAGMRELMDPGSSPFADNRSALALRQFRQATDALAVGAKLDLRHLTLCERVNGFGQIEPIARGTVRPGQSVVVYVEVENFASEAVRNPVAGYRSQFELNFRLTNPATGQRRELQTREPPEDFCHRIRRDYFIACLLDVPNDLSGGEYDLELAVQDRQSGKYGHALKRFTVRTDR